MYFVVDGSVYAERPDGKYVNVEVIGKDKVIEIRELESVTVNEGDVVIDDVGGAFPCTLDTIIKKFNVSGSNPIPFAKPKKTAKKSSRKAKPEAESEDEDF